MPRFYAIISYEASSIEEAYDLIEEDGLSFPSSFCDDPYDGPIASVELIDSWDPKIKRFLIATSIDREQSRPVLACTCGAKTPQTQHHSIGCPVRRRGI